MTVKKAPVVMFHGAFTGPWVWGGFAEKFKSAGYKVHTPCLRHHENKKPSAGLAQVSLTDYAADLGSFLDELGTPAILVGHSMGGFLAQMVAAKKKFTPLCCWCHPRPGACRLPPCSKSPAPRPCC